jgi:hypothetical protein
MHRRRFCRLCSEPAVSFHLYGSRNTAALGDSTSVEGIQCPCSWSRRDRFAVSRRPAGLRRHTAPADPIPGAEADNDARGSNLAHVGSRLPSSAINRALVDSSGRCRRSAAFQSKQRRELVYFLAQLRSRAK